MKKIAFLNNILCFALSIGLLLPSTAFAAENKRSEDSNSACNAVDYSFDDFSPDMADFYEKAMFCSPLNEGDIKLVGTWDGEEIYVEVTNVTEASNTTYSTNGTLEQSQQYIFYKKGLLGIKTNLFSVTSTCTWIKGDKILNLHCAYEILKSGVSCSWDEEYTKATDILHTLGLDVSYNGDARFILFGAGLSFDREELMFQCSADTEF